MDRRSDQKGGRVGRAAKIKELIMAARPQDKPPPQTPLDLQGDGAFSESRLRQQDADSIGPRGSSVELHPFMCSYLIKIKNCQENQAQRLLKVDLPKIKYQSMTAFARTLHFLEWSVVVSVVNLCSLVEHWWFTNVFFSSTSFKVLEKLYKEKKKKKKVLSLTGMITDTPHSALLDTVTRIIC